MQHKKLLISLLVVLGIIVILSIAGYITYLSV